MDRIPLINPKLIKVVAANAQSRPTSVLQAEVIASEPLKDSNSQQYKVTLKIGQQQLETISSENFKKGSQLEVKIAPGPELKILQNQPPAAVVSRSQNTSAPAQLAMQQLLADRIPNIQTQELPKLIDQLSQLLSTGKIAPPLGAATSTTTTSTITNTTTSNSSSTNASTHINTMGIEAKQAESSSAKSSTQQSIANLAYKSLSASLEQNTKASSLTQAQPSTSDNVNKTSDTTPLQQVKTWLQQLPKSEDIGHSIGLRNAVNNAGPRAEIQLSQLAQQLITLNQKGDNPAERLSANSLFQQLQKIQQQVLTSAPEASSKTELTKTELTKTELAQTDLASLVKNTAKTLATNTQQVLESLKLSPKRIEGQGPTPLMTTAMKSPVNTPTGSTANPAISNWQNPLLNSQTYANINNLMQDPLLQNPSSNNKFALSQILMTQGEPPQVPLNWPERSGNDATILRTLQNLLAHIEREQGVQMQSSDNSPANSPVQPTPQNQHWLPLLINHQQQLQLIEFFIDKEERENSQGEKKNHWFINLHFDLPQLGKLGIEITMLDNECNTTFWSESSSTLNQLSHHIQPLRQRLTDQGIIVSDVQSRHGTLAKRKHNIQQRLVDIKT